MHQITAGLLAALSLTACTSQPDTKATATPTPPAARQPAARAASLRTAAYAGEYRWGKAGSGEPGGMLTVYPESDSTILLQIDANGGAPAYNMVNVFGRATVRGATAHYATKSSEDEPGCRLTIAFAPKAAEVAGVKGYTDCYFGGNMTADGTYRRISQRIPAYVIDTAGDTLRFAHLPPDALADSK